MTKINKRAADAESEVPQRSGILFYGDPHGTWRPLVDAVLEHKPAAVVLVGDMGLNEPLQFKLHAIWNLVPEWKWIIGNHDVDSYEEYDSLVAYPEGNLGGRWAKLDGRIIAGLGGVYRASVWYPRFTGGAEPPIYNTRQDLAKVTPKFDRMEGDLPLAYRATIFPEDHAALKKVRADILVCHQAPSSHHHGFEGIDDLARDMRVGLVIHGHHHESYQGHTRDGIPVRGLGLAEPWLYRHDQNA